MPSARWPGVSAAGGHLVTIGSIAGRIGAPFEAVYSATKFAQVGLTESLSVGLSPYGIGVSMVNPGPVSTDFFDARASPTAGRCPGRSHPSGSPTPSCERSRPTSWNSSCPDGSARRCFSVTSHRPFPVGHAPHLPRRARRRRQGPPLLSLSAPRGTHGRTSTRTVDRRGDPGGHRRRSGHRQARRVGPLLDDHPGRAGQGRAGDVRRGPTRWTAGPAADRARPGVHADRGRGEPPLG